jgi:hypothetical protein
MGATELSMTVRKYFGDGGDGTYIGWFCHASPDTWYAYGYGDGGGGVGYCSPNDPVSPPPPDRDLGPSTFQFLPEPLPVQMYVFKPTKAQKRCLKRYSTGDCKIRPAASTDAIFGFAIHEHRATRSVLHLGKDLGFEVGHLEDPLDFAALVIQGGQEYLIEHLAPTGSWSASMSLTGSAWSVSSPPGTSGQKRATTATVRSTASPGAEIQRKER